MHQTEEAILQIFKDNISKELNTEFLAMKIYPKEYSNAENLIHSIDKSTIHSGKRIKFQLHRKILYYLNKLVDGRIIRVSRMADKGEKFFTLISGSGETIIEKGYKKTILTPPTLIKTYIEQYEKHKIIKIFEEDSWINKFNSILLECNSTRDIKILYETIITSMSNINDAIGLNDFENIINTTNDKTLQDFLERISKDVDKSNKIVSIIINISKCSNNLHQFIDYYSLLNPKRINIIFNISNKDLQKNSKIIHKIFEKFSESKIKINFKNDDLSIAPYFKGRAGMYNFADSEWKLYREKSSGKTIGIICSQSQIAININKFFETYNTDSEFRDAILNAAKTLLTANMIQRRRSNEYFNNINTINEDDSKEFYRHSKNYIRFWNYDWHKSISEEDTLFDLIKSSKILVDKLCNTEETIFKSCGVPIRFKIAFSSAFRNFDAQFMGEREYKKMTINKPEEYYVGEIKKFIQAREKMFEIFDGGDRLRIFRKSDFSINDIVHEISILLSGYSIPFFTFDFSGLRGTVKLTSFM